MGCGCRCELGCGKYPGWLDKLPSGQKPTEELVCGPGWLGREVQQHGRTRTWSSCACVGVTHQAQAACVSQAARGHLQGAAVTGSGQVGELTVTPLHSQPWGWNQPRPTGLGWGWVHNSHVLYLVELHQAVVNSAQSLPISHLARFGVGLAGFGLGLVWAAPSPGLGVVRQLCLLAEGQGGVSLAVVGAEGAV